jgi:transposase-like protein
MKEVDYMYGMPKMKNCPNCNEEMFYNNRYHMFECNDCEKTYNYSLQELAPLSEWKDEYDNEDY